MISYKIEYTVKKSKKDTVIGLVNEFIDGIRNNEPDTIIYHAYQEVQNSYSFIHFMTFRDKQAEEAHRNSSYCNKFTEELYPLCEKEPEYIPLKLLR